MAENQRTYTDADRALVAAKMRLGEGPTAIAVATGFPQRTVEHMMMRLREVAAEQGDRELADRDYRVAIRADELIHDAFDYISQDESGERASKNLIALNAIRGTAIDKTLKRKDLHAPESLITQLLADRAQRIRYRTVTEYEVITDPIPPDHEALP